jgi:type I restriction enzyme S subunit
MELEKYTFRDLLSRIVDNRGKTCPTAMDGTALIATNCVKDNQLYPVFENVRWVDSETMYTWFRGHPEVGDILFVTKGSPGRCCMVPDPVDFCIAQDMLALRADESKVSQKFLFALLRSSIVHDLIGNLHVGTMIPHFKKGDFNQLILQIPKSRKIQNWIGDLCFTLSNKIELNRQMNATLEGMAQALFKSWFVDFDPVIDNALAAGNPIPEELAQRAEVRRKALADGTANREVAKQFPDAFQRTEEMGWIPEGWMVTNIGRVASIIKGVSYKSVELTESKTALVTLKSFKRGGGYRLDGLKEYVGKFKPEQKVESGDLIIAYTDVTQAADVIGKPAMVIANNKYETLVASLDVGIVRPCSESIRYYLYGLAQTIHFQAHTASHSTGTTVLHLSKQAVPGYIFTHPEEELLLKYQDISMTIFNEIQNRTEQSSLLEKLRDTLLPKLISGELRIPEAEKLTEEALA